MMLRFLWGIPFLVLLLSPLHVTAYPQGDDAPLNIWPSPQQAQLGSGRLRIDDDNFQFLFPQQGILAKDVANITAWYQHVMFGNRTGIRPYREAIDINMFLTTGNADLYPNRPLDVLTSLVLEVDKTDSKVDLQLGIDESYTLSIKGKNQAKLSAPTYFGLVKGLETFSQLVKYTQFKGGEVGFQVSRVPLVILDKPTFAWRGLLLDTSRHFIPLGMVYETIDILCHNKMNTLHWHITDADSFPFESRVFPGLSANGAYSEDAVYSQGDIVQLVEYARLRGVRIVPEFDMPGHTASFAAGMPTIVAHCREYLISRERATAFQNVALDPTQNATFEFLDKFLQEVSSLFPDKYLHLGGDEVATGCWDGDASIATRRDAMGMTNEELYGYFEQRVQAIGNKHGKTVVLWQEPFDKGFHLAPTTVVNVWKDHGTLQKVVESGRKAVMSWGYYLDKQSPTDSPPHWMWIYTWRDMYRNGVVPQGLDPQYLPNILGGEMSSWDESVDGANIHTRIWSRGAAVAERLWSNPTTNPSNKDYELATLRMSYFRCALVQRGHIVGPIRQDYCEGPTIGIPEPRRPSPVQPSVMSTGSAVAVGILGVIVGGVTVAVFAIVAWKRRVRQLTSPHDRPRTMSDVDHALPVTMTLRDSEY